MVTWCAKWQRNGKKSNLKETREKTLYNKNSRQGYTERKTKRKQRKKKESGLSSALQWTSDSVPLLNLGFLLAQRSISWATSHWNFLLVVCLLLKILSFLIFQRFSMHAAKHTTQA
jgi:Flp pilus assembly protein TadB